MRDDAVLQRRVLCAPLLRCLLRLRHLRSGFQRQGLGFRLQGLGRIFRVWVSGSGLPEVLGSGLPETHFLWGLEFRVSVVLRGVGGFWISEQEFRMTEEG